MFLPDVFHVPLNVKLLELEMVTVFTVCLTSEVKLLLIAEIFISWPVGFLLLVPLNMWFMILSLKKGGNHNVYLICDWKSAVLNILKKKKVLSISCPFMLTFIAILALLQHFDSLKMYARDVIPCVLMVPVCIWMMLSKCSRGRRPELLPITQGFFHNLGNLSRKSDPLG